MRSVRCSAAAAAWSSALELLLAAAPAPSALSASMAASATVEAAAGPAVAPVWPTAARTYSRWLSATRRLDPPTMATAAVRTSAEKLRAGTAAA